MFSENIHTENQEVFLPELQEKNIQLFIKREDTINAEVSGNKFRKLKYNLQKAKDQKKTTLLTFGGAFSNHILATASAGSSSGFKTIGVIRGEELGIDISKTLETNSTLKRADSYGMHLDFVSREQYRNKTEAEFLKSLEERYGDFYLIPEGGTNELAVKGCEEILTTEDQQFDYICSCVGTGGTISGIINSAHSHQKILGFPALKGSFLKEEIKPFVKNENSWELTSMYHFNGYGKYTKELIEFINRFKRDTKIPLDPVYTGKMVYGILDMVRKDQFLSGSKILAIHTGGLQGIAGFNQRLQKKQKDLKIDS
ncbi:MAG: 1-aminocyclopropane-1-carboxylate deaminase/D-cysteine desulfhydrase [Flavobacteriaceae bacterium]